MNDNDIDMNIGDTNTGEEAVHSTDSTSDTAVIDIDDICIGDKEAPMILLFGPPDSGKSMTLVRLARYLYGIGYEIKADTNFKADSAYQKCCAKFEKSLSTKDALDSTPHDEFLMVKVIDHGETVCQILEAPGEHYFNPKEPEKIKAVHFRPYMTHILRKQPNRKIWIFITEAGWNVHTSVKKAYVKRIQNCKDHLFGRSDRVITLYNKIDQKDEFFVNGTINISAAEKAMRDEYTGLSDVFKNHNPITSLWRPYNYVFVPFCTGYYTEQPGKSKKRYEESEDFFPAFLWRQLMKSIKG